MVDVAVTGEATAFLEPAAADLDIDSPARLLLLEGRLNAELERMQQYRLAITAEVDELRAGVAANRAGVESNRDSVAVVSDDLSVVRSVLMKSLLTVSSLASTVSDRYGDDVEVLGLAMALETALTDALDRIRPGRRAP